MKLEPRDSEFRRRKEVGWQLRAFQHIDLVPELSYASRFYAKMLKKIRIYPALRDEYDVLTPIKTGPPVDLLDRIQDPGGGRSQLLASYGRLMFITGDGYLFGRDLGQDAERWSFVSLYEIDLTNKGEIIWRPTSQHNPETLPAGSAVAYRMWSPHPHHSGEADSPMRAIGEVAEELVILTRAVRATAVTRMTNGILKVPAELSFGADEGSDDDPENNQFLADMIDHMTGVIENAGSAEAATPFLAEGADEFLANFVWMKTHDPATDYMERDLRIEAVRRLSLGLDMPPEVLMGIGATNHWIGRQIMLEQWRSHGAPVAEQFADDLGDAYLRPALREAGYPDWRKVVVGIDDTQVVVSPDRSTDADQAFDRGGLGWEGYRRMKGIPETMAPDEEEMKIYLAIKLRNPAFLDGTPYAISAPSFQPGLPGPNRNPAQGLPASEEPPPPGPDGTSRPDSSSYIIQGAAHVALYRCRELAGSRILGKYKNEVRPVIDGHPTAMIASVIGQDRLQSLGSPDPFKLVAGGTEGFAVVAREIGLTEAQAGSLSETLLVHAAKTLFDAQQPELSSGFLAQVERMREVASCLT